MNRTQVIGALLSVIWTTASSQEINTPPVRTALVPTQRVGDAIIQGGATPTWHVPGNRVVASKVPESIAGGPPSTGKAGSGQDAKVAPARTSSNDWKSRISKLEEDIDSNKKELVDAKASFISAVNDELRQREEQVIAAQRQVEQLKLQAQKAAEVAAALKAHTEPQATPAPAVAVATPIPANAPPLPIFTLRREDRSIASALQRWANDAQYTLLWEAKDEPAAFEDEFQMAFPDAVERVLMSLRVAGKDVSMCEYTNRVVRVITKSASCKLAVGAIN